MPSILLKEKDCYVIVNTWQQARYGVYTGSCLLALEGRSPESAIIIAEDIPHICVRCHVLSVLSHG